MANILILDTETISAEAKRFCYNVGWVVYNTDTQECLEEKDRVIEQIWHNAELFATAYYAEKKNLYISAMRGKRATLDKWGYVMRELARDIREHHVQAVFAYNSPFDDSVIEFNCDWFHTINPLENVPVKDIRGMVSAYITNTKEYIDFCEEHQLLTEAGHYSTTAESVARFILNDPTFEEEHTALADAQLETDIIQECINRGAGVMEHYKVTASIPRRIPKPLRLVVDGETVYEGEFIKKWSKEGYYRFTTPDGIEE